MWVYLEIAPDGPGLRVELVKGDRKVGRYPILYDATCRAVAETVPDVDALEGVVIPDSLGGGYNFDASLLILQLRLETTSGLQKLPIKVRFDEDDGDRYDSFCKQFNQSGVDEERRAAIGVFLAHRLVEPTQTCPPRTAAVQRYIDQVAGRPWFPQGRHNQANRWGPYVFFRVVEQLDSACSAARESIERRMFEEPYLKRLADNFQAEALSKKLRDELRSEQLWLRDSLRAKDGGRKILVVEDQLDEGWDEVYKALFDSSDAHVSMVWATTVDEARASFAKDIDLVVLDVRLDPKDDVSVTPEEVVPTGVLLAKELRNACSTVPILAGTASNKTWIMEPLLKEGIQGYWVKESPEQAGSLTHATRNVIDLYKMTREILKWSDRTRPWIEGLYAIANEVAETDVRQGNILEDKAHSLHALLHRAFSPFSRELDDGLQLNVAFLIVFSCMNDLRAWCCRVEEKEDGGKDWITAEEIGGDMLVTKRRRGSHKGGPKFVYKVEGSDKESEAFPDTEASKMLLIKLGCATKGTVFRKLKNEVRNAIPLTHGVSDAETVLGGPGRTATDDDIADMLGILQTVVEKRRSVTRGSG
ncbi:MAG: hypothetical protein K9L70_01570 [Thiohalocapsa sp.]|nr:hypothetical protein [Thiohalocapsa sp.]MCF7990908.1 hypothetical protein [Thiohalocapsa sp.]